jgi:hypothetical protein
MNNTENARGLNNFQKTETLLTGNPKQYPTTMKNADRPFLLIILIAITLLYTVMAFIS